MTVDARTTRARLISTLRQQAEERNKSGWRTGTQTGGEQTTLLKCWSEKAFDFSQLDEVRMLEVQRMIAASAGVSSPFFRMQDGPPRPGTLIDGHPQVSFASYNYLGLNSHPRVAEAAKAAIDRFGISATASRLVGGERPAHRAFETALADFLGVEDVVAMVSGHATNVTTIGTLLGQQDLIIADELCHNSVSEGARLSHAARLSFPHNDYAWLEAKLRGTRHRFRRVLIAVEGLYSMDGDCPDLTRLIDIKTRHDAWLMVDEAHALGVLGATGRGSAEAQGIDPGAVEIWMGTLSKSLASCGGYIAGSRALIDLLKATAPGFVFSVGIAPALAAAAATALDILRCEPDRVAALQRNGCRFRDAARCHGLDTGLSEGHAITPVLIGDSLRAVKVSDRLYHDGMNILPIIHPAVPERQARLRAFVTSEHSDAQIDLAARSIAQGLKKTDANTHAHTA